MLINDFNSLSKHINFIFIVLSKLFSLTDYTVTSIVFLTATLLWGFTTNSCCQGCLCTSARLFTGYCESKYKKISIFIFSISRTPLTTAVETLGYKNPQLWISTLNYKPPQWCWRKTAEVMRNISIACMNWHVWHLVVGDLFPSACLHEVFI